MLYIIEKLKDIFHPDASIWKLIKTSGEGLEDTLVKVCEKHGIQAVVLSRMISSHFEDPDFMKR